MENNAVAGAALPEAVESIARAISASAKYRAIAPQAVRRVTYEEYRKQPDGCEKRARRRLHIIADAFMDTTAQKALNDCLARGDTDGALRLHASTRERLPSRAEYIALLRELLPEGGLICDAACGLDPLLLGSEGFRALGLDIQLSCVDAINRWAAASGWDVRAEGCDLASVEALPECELTLLMKLLPVMDAQSPGGAEALLKAVRSPLMLVSYPRYSLSGARRGMDRNYASAFESLIAQARPDMEIDRRVDIANELFFVVRRR